MANFARSNTNDLWSWLASLDEGNKRSVKLGRSYSQTDIADMYFNSLAQDYFNQSDRNWQEAMYNEYESIPAQIRQYQQEGLNPALMYGSAPSASGSFSSGSASAPSASAGGSIQDPTMQIISMMLQGLTGVSSVAGQIGDTVSNIQLRGSQRKLNQQNTAVAQAEEDNIRANTENVEQDTLLKKADTQLKEIDVEFARAEKTLALQEADSRINKNISDVAKSMSDISVNDSVIELNGSRIDLNRKDLDVKDQQILLMQSERMLNNLNADKIREMLPLQKELVAAQALLANAQTDAQDQLANDRYFKAYKNYLDVMVQQDLIDKGLVDQLWQQTQATTKGMKIDNTFKIVDGIVDNTCKVVNTAVGVATGTGGLANAASELSVKRYNAVTSRMNAHNAAVRSGAKQPYSTGFGMPKTSAL